MTTDTSVDELLKCPVCGQPRYIEWLNGGGLERAVAVCDTDMLTETLQVGYTGREPSPEDEAVAERLCGYHAWKD